MSRVLVVHASRTGHTEKIAELIGEGLRMEGVDVTLEPAAKITKEEDLQGYDGYVFGSATYHGDMMQPMKTMLFLADKAGLAGKVGGSFGAFGWSGEAHERIFNTMLHVLNMNMVSDSLRLKSSALEGGKQMAQEYGRQVARKLKG